MINQLQPNKKKIREAQTSNGIGRWYPYKKGACDFPMVHPKVTKGWGWETATCLCLNIAGLGFGRTLHTSTPCVESDGVSRRGEAQVPGLGACLPASVLETLPLHPAVCALQTCHAKAFFVQCQSQSLVLFSLGGGGVVKRGSG